MFRKILLLGILAGVGCSDDTPTSPSAALDGVWRIVSIQPTGLPSQPAPVSAQYQVGFENERVFLRVDCNTCTGPFTSSGSTLLVGPTLACTRAACETAAYESAVVSMLSVAHEMSSTQHNLTLTSPRGTMLLQR